MHFSGPRPPKHLPEPYVYKGFCPGAAKVNSGAQKRISGARNAKNGGIPPFFGDYWAFSRNGTVPLENGPLNHWFAQGSGKAENDDFS